MSKGVRIAKPGFDVFTAEKTDLYVDTDTPIFKVSEIGEGSISFSASETNTTKDIDIPTGLGYKSQWWVYAERRPGERLRTAAATDILVSIGGVPDLMQIVTGVVDNNVIRIRFVSGATNPAGTYRYYYYIFYDETR